MHFSMFTTVHATGGAKSPSQTLDFFREQVILGDQLGFRVIWIGEHHFGPYGQGDFPNPIVLAADLAARTERIRVGQMANIAVWWHPIRLAEDIAILDQLTKGRVETGFGRGIWPYEGPQFHPNADPRKDAENRELFREVVDVRQESLDRGVLLARRAELPFPRSWHHVQSSHVSLRSPVAGWRDGHCIEGYTEALPETTSAPVVHRVY